MRSRILTGALLAAVPLVAGAEVKFATAEAMLIEHRFTIAAPAGKAWESLVHPELWWPEDHTWSGERQSLSLAPVAGGCYCERWHDSSAEHGRVVMAIPRRLLTLDAALGPFLEMAISGILSIKLDGLAPTVDQVLGLQFGNFAAHAGEP